MKRAIFLCLSVAVLSGCASYKFQRGKPPYEAGYVALRDNYPLVAYTVGPNDSVPEDLALAKERFKRRRPMVEYYEKRLGTIENRFKEAFWDRLVLAGKLVTGVFRLPFIAVHDYRYTHNPQYQAKVKEAQEQADLREEARMQKLKEELNDYIAQDLSREGIVSARPADTLAPAGEEKLEPKTEKLAYEAAVEPAEPEIKESAPAQEVAQLEQAVVEKKSALEQIETIGLPTSAKPAPAKAARLKPVKKEKKEKPVAAKKQKPAPVKVKATESPAEVKAVISAKPAKGYSPLKVHFNAGSSRASSGRIVAYAWDFGDGDTSSQKNPTNTFWSASYEPRIFTVTLTVNDGLGNSDTATQEIEVLNK